MSKYSSTVLRCGIALVMIWFGSQQLLNATPWTSFLPEWVGSLPLSEIAFVHINGIFEVIAGTMLFFGIYTRLVSALLGLHLFGIVISLGMNATAVRDFGLVVALASIFLTGPDQWSLDTKLKSKNNVTTL